MYIIKVGDLYLTADGTLSARQSDALRVRDAVLGQSPRAVKLTPHGTGKYAQTSEPHQIGDVAPDADNDPTGRFRA